MRTKYFLERFNNRRADETSCGLVQVRGERLYPPRSHRLYWVLTRLREEIEEFSDLYLRDLVGWDSKLIDFGCGNMPYRPILSQYVGEYIGCDLADNPVADCRLDRPDVLPISEGHADVVLSSQVLEHAADPVLYLSECHRVLRAGGVMILSTHGVWRYHPDPIDLWRWTSAGLRQVVEKSGFVIEDFRGILGPAATGLQVWQDAVIYGLRRPFRNGFTWSMQQMIRAADRRCSPACRNADASIYILIARKRFDA